MPTASEDPPTTLPPAAAVGSSAGSDVPDEDLSKEEREGIAVYNYVRMHPLQPPLMSLLQDCGSADVRSVR